MMVPNVHCSDMFTLKTLFMLTTPIPEVLVLKVVLTPKAVIPKVLVSKVEVRIVPVSRLEVLNPGTGGGTTSEARISQEASTIPLVSFSTTSLECCFS